MTMTNTPTGHITPEDLENKLRSFQGGIQGRITSKKDTLLAVGSSSLTVLLIIVFLLGKRSGKKKSTVVEIRRI